MELTDSVKNLITRALIAIIVIVIAVIYYVSELRPFHYQGYEKNINELQRFDAELNEAIVLSRFGILRHYDPIDKSLNNVANVIQSFKIALESYPNSSIETNLQKLEQVVSLKEDLIVNFKKINPIMINAINQFSTLLAQIIEAQANEQLVEKALQQDLNKQYEDALHYQIIDKINNLFRGILIYITLRHEEHRKDLIQLVKDLKQAPKKDDKYPKLDLALAYADKILELQPQLTKIDQQLFELPIVQSLNTLNNAYKSVFEKYLSSSRALRIILYILTFVLLVVLRWAFIQLRGMVNTLNIEIHKKIRAEKELEQANRELEQRVADRTRELSLKNSDLNQALGDLKEAQDQLIIQEKMASVGMLTTGIAHEIKNPLNFVNNFSDISVELVGELSAELETNKEKIGPESLSFIQEILNDLKTNCSKIKEHGVRADNIVKTMLMHSQEAGVEKEMCDIKGILDDNVQITLDAFRSQHEKFDAKIEKRYSPVLKKVLGASQTIARLFVYLIDNALYAMREKQTLAGPDYQPTLTLTLEQENENAIIKIKDNGTGIAKKNLDRVFEPFFTTKPTGKGNTGLGLSICYDTVVKQHKGELRVASDEGVYTEITISLPINPRKSEG